MCKFYTFVLFFIKHTYFCLVLLSGINSRSCCVLFPSSFFFLFILLIRLLLGLSRRPWESRQVSLERQATLEPSLKKWFNWWMCASKSYQRGYSMSGKAEVDFYWAHPNKATCKNTLPHYHHLELYMWVTSHFNLHVAIALQTLAGTKRLQCRSYQLHCRTISHTHSAAAYTVLCKETFSSKNAFRISMENSTIKNNKRQRIMQYIFRIV